jgi:hypothetical protein
MWSAISTFSSVRRLERVEGLEDEADRFVAPHACELASVIRQLDAVDPDAALVGAGC